MHLLPISLAKNLFLRSLAGMRHGALELISNGESHQFGDAAADGLRATVVIHNERFFHRAVVGGDVGMGESWMDGDWSSPDLVAVVRLAVRNLGELESQNRWLSAFRRGMDRLKHRSRGNSVQGSRRNIRAHYDLSNEFFRLFLDQNMMYSCAYYEGADDSIERAQFNKLDRVCRKLALGSDDSVLEIGTGWGGFAEHAASNYGCHVTTTTISREQHDYAQQRFEKAGLKDRVELLLEDYRNLRGQYSRIVSIEMFEAVGLEHYDEFFGTCDRLLEPDGAMLLQTITMNERTFPAYRGRADWIQKHVFPGSELASMGEILKSLARGTKLAMQHAEDIGLHYARTLADWRERFHGAIDGVRSLGFDDRFVRMWDYYLAYCEGAFRERHIGDFQLVLTKADVRGILGNAGLTPDVTYASAQAR
jgi:cyclopropane-fatty-acyl-phospholipid synthase